MTFPNCLITIAIDVTIVSWNTWGELCWLSPLFLPPEKWESWMYISIVRRLYNVVLSCKSPYTFNEKKTSRPIPRLFQRSKEVSSGLTILPFFFKASPTQFPIRFYRCRTFRKFLEFFYMYVQNIAQSEKRLTSNNACVIAYNLINITTHW
jgi:hypothetical protein